MADRISGIPTSLLAGILSLVPLRILLLCGFPSKGWKAALVEMLATAADLDFGWKLPEGFLMDQIAGGLPPPRYYDAVDAALALHAPATTLRRVRFFFGADPGDRLDRVDSWLQFAADTGAAEVALDLLLYPLPAPEWLLQDGAWEFAGTPQCWRSLTHLSLSYIPPNLPAVPPEQLHLLDDPRDVLLYYQDLSIFGLEQLELPHLQVLSLQRVHNRILAHLLSRCPRLSTVTLRHCFWFGEDMFASESLTSLTIICCQTGSRQIHVSAPALRSFRFFGDIGGFELGDVEDVYISSIGWRCDPHITWHRFLSRLVSVSTLTLSDAPLEHLWWYNIDNETLPVFTFRNLKSFQLLIERKHYIKLLYYFLQIAKFPVLENLFIEFSDELLDENDLEDYRLDGPEEEEEYELPIPDVPYSELTLVCIKGFTGDRDQFTVAKFVLASAVTLDKLVLYVAYKPTESPSDYELDALQKKLDALPKASRNAKLLVGLPDDHLVSVPPPPHAEFHQENVPRKRGSDLADVRVAPQQAASKVHVGCSAAGGTEISIGVHGVQPSQPCKHISRREPWPETTEL